MNQRLKGALVLAPFIIALFFGNVIRTLILMAMGVVAYHELRAAFAKKNIKVLTTPGIVIPAALLAISFTNNYQDITNILKLSGIIVAVSIFVEEQLNWKNIIVTLGSVIYAFAPFLMLTILGFDSEGELYIIFVLMTAFITDICAMQAGKYFGKHKLTKISPNKTIEGSIGGIVGAMIVCGIFGLFIGAPFLFMTLIGAVCSIFAQLGDLFASAIKRYCGIKDFSNLIPGHGGILDRFDSVIFVSVAFFLIYLIMA